MRTLLIAIFGFVLTGADQTKEQSSEFKILFATTDEKRGERFKKFFESHKLSCAVVKYKEITKKLLDSHDMFMPDTPEGGHKEVGGAMKEVNVKNIPQTDKPIFGIATLGCQVLRTYNIALGKIKT